MNQIRLELHGEKRAAYLHKLESLVAALPVLGFPSTRLTYTRGYFIACWTLVPAVMAWAWLSMPLWLSLVCGVVGYAYLQVAFMLFHVYIHAHFVEVPVEDQPLGVYIAYKHHYEVATALCLREHTRAYLSPRALSVFITAFGISTVAFGDVGVAVGSSAVFWWMMQGPVHEYYHLPGRLRQTYFNPVMRRWLGLLDRVGLIGLKDHSAHHAHGPKSLETAQKFDDMWVPRAVSRAIDLYWMALQRLRRPGDTPMVRVSLGVMLGFQVLGAIVCVALVAGLVAVVG